MTAVLYTNSEFKPEDHAPIDAFCARAPRVMHALGEAIVTRWLRGGYTAITLPLQTSRRRPRRTSTRYMTDCHNTVTDKSQTSETDLYPIPAGCFSDVERSGTPSNPALPQGGMHYEVRTAHLPRASQSQALCVRRSSRSARYATVL